MATTINLSSEKNGQQETSKDIIKKFGTPEREPDKALDGMYGLWKKKNTTIQDIREKKRRKKWL